MAQQEKLTKKLDLSKSARIVGRRLIAKAANYEIDYRTDADSGSLIVVDNSSQSVWITLPTITGSDGKYFNFFNANTGEMHITAATNVMINRLGTTISGVNYGQLGGILGASCGIWGDGAFWYHIDSSPINTVAMANIDAITEVWPFTQE